MNQSNQYCTEVPFSTCTGVDSEAALRGVTIRGREERERGQAVTGPNKRQTCTQVWVRSIREVTRLFNEAGLTISASTVHAIQSQRDDREVGRPNARKIRPLPAWATFQAVGVRGERDSE